jgi:hypothetical protein
MVVSSSKNTMPEACVSPGHELRQPDRQVATTLSSGSSSVRILMLSDS